MYSVVNLQVTIFLAVLRRATLNRHSVTAALDNVGVWTSMVTRLPAPESKATQTAVRRGHARTRKYALEIGAALSNAALPVCLSP